MLWKIKSSEMGAHIHIHTQHKNKKQTRRCVSFTSVQNDGGWAVAAHYNKPTYIRNKNRLQCGQQALLLKNAGYSQHQLLLYPTLTEVVLSGKPGLGLLWRVDMSACENEPSPLIGKAVMTLTSANIKQKIREET